MVVQAGAARHVIGRDPDRAEEAIAEIERTGRDALTELRRLLGVLRANGDPDAGLDVELEIRDRVQAVVYAYEHGVVRPGAS